MDVPVASNSNSIESPTAAVPGSAVSEKKRGRVPGFYEKVTRPRHVRVTALDRNGESFTIEPEGLLAVCIQHECDHLNGKLFVDYLSNLKRQRIRAKLEKQRKEA